MTSEQRYKQVILVRKDLKMRRGKEIAQGSHASMAFLVDQLRRQMDQVDTSRNNGAPATIQLDQAQWQWLKIGVAKVCLRVNSEEDLQHYHALALEHGLVSHLIRDSGRTEFGGVPTLTACAIGPDKVEAIDVVTGDLVLY